MAFYPLIKLHFLHEGFYQVFSVANTQVVVTCDNGKHHLFINRCPHMGKPLTNATVRGGVLRCPSHGAEFDLASGAGVNSGGALQKLLPAYDGNTLGVEL